MDSDLSVPAADQPLFELIWLRVQSSNYSLVVGALYHPPRPLYQEADLLTYIETCIDYLNTTFSDSWIILAGDFNALSEQQIIMRTGLSPIVHQPTRGGNCLDRIFV